MTKYIDAEKLKEILKSLIKERKRWMKDPAKSDRQDQLWSDLNGEDMSILQIINILQQDQPEPYFYCKYGGTVPLCSDCKRNHNNSFFKTEEITTWYTPSNGTKHCIDYIQQEQPEIFDTIAFQKGVKEGKRLAIETIRARIDEIIGDAQPAPILRMELQELIKKINQ